MSNPKAVPTLFEWMGGMPALERLMDPGSVSDELLGHLLAAIVEAFTTRKEG